MYNSTLTSKGARKYDASAIAQTGSFLAIQVIASSSLLNVPNSPIHAGKGYLVPASQSFAKFSNITWGNAKDSSPDTSEQATNLTALGGERIEGPIYGFTMTTGSCLAYLF